MHDIDTKVDEALAAWGFTFAARYVGECKQWEDQTVDHFRVSFARPAMVTFETGFYMGLGNRKQRHDKPCPYRAGTIAAADWNRDNLRPAAPSATSVLYSLLSDAAATDQCFADWASDLGYDTDSRKALATYEACCDTGLKMRRVFTSAQRAELSTLLQEY